MDEDYIKKAKEEITRWESKGPGYLARVGDFILWPGSKSRGIANTRRGVGNHRQGH